MHTHLIEIPRWHPPGRNDLNSSAPEASSFKARAEVVNADMQIRDGFNKDGAKVAIERTARVLIDRLGLIPIT